jgi:acetylornithine deacetylase/succinyl-diaminopimelate desuccinylase-like protein
MNFESLTAAQALALAQARKPELLDLLTRLVATRSLAGESAQEAQRVVMDHLALLSYTVEASADAPSAFAQHAEYMPPIPKGDGPFINVIAQPRAPAHARFGLFAHIDTHEVANGWHSEPLAPLVKDGRLYGLGAADGKGGIAAMLIAASVMAEARGPLPVVISIHGKGGGSRGSLPVFERLGHAGQAIDALIYAHPAETGRGLRDIKHIVRGVLDLTLTVQGWQGKPLEIGLPDSALWSEGGDALQTCLQAIAHLKDGVLRDAEVNVGKLEAGRTAGAVADHARVELRVLFESRSSWRTLLESARGALDAFAARLPAREQAFRFSLEPGAMRCNAGSSPWDGPYCRIVRAAIEDVTGIAPASYPNPYGGDIRFPLRLLGVPAFGIGSRGGNFYGPDEWVDIDDLVRLVAVIVLALSGRKRAA